MSVVLYIVITSIITFNIYSLDRNEIQHKHPCKNNITHVNIILCMVWVILLLGLAVAKAENTNF